MTDNDEDGNADTGEPGRREGVLDAGELGEPVRGARGAGASPEAHRRRRPAEKTRWSTPVDQERTGRRRGRGSSGVEAHQKRDGVLETGGGGRRWPELMVFSPESERETVNLGAIEKLLGRFLWGG